MGFTFSSEIRVSVGIVCIQIPVSIYNANLLCLVMLFSISLCLLDTALKLLMHFYDRRCIFN